MATRMHNSLDMVFEFVLFDEVKQENYTKKVTLKGINPNLTNEQYLEVGEKIDSLLKQPVAAIGLVTSQYLMPGNPTT